MNIKIKIIIIIYKNHAADDENSQGETGDESSDHNAKIMNISTKQYLRPDRSLFSNVQRATS
jgi:hypothetical protein